MSCVYSKGTFPFVHMLNVSAVKGGTELMIATDPLSLLFIACFLTGLVFFIVTALLGNLGHCITHHVAHQVEVIHTTSTHTVSNVTTHTSGQVPGSHAASHGHANAQGQH